MFVCVYLLSCLGTFDQLAAEFAGCVTLTRDDVHKQCVSEYTDIFFIKINW